MNRWLGLFGLACSMCLSAGAEDLFDLSLEELLEIKITSRRFEEAYVDVPRSITVVSESNLEEGSFLDLTEAVGQLPNVSVRQSFGRWRSKLVSRAIGNIVGENVVSVMVDGLPMSSFGPSASLHDVERIEVLRGSDVALYGRGAFAGVINIVTKRPEEGTAGRVSLSVDDEGGYDASLIHDFEFGSEFDLMLTARSYDNPASYQNTLGTGDAEIGGEGSDELALSGSWQANGALTISFRSLYQDIDDGSLPTYLQSSAFNNCFLDSTPQYYCGVLATPQEVGANLDREYLDPGFRREIAMHHLALKWDYDGSRIEFRAGLQDQDYQVDFDGDLYELEAAYTSRSGGIDETSLELVASWDVGSGNRLLIGASEYLRTDDYIQDQTLIVFGAPRESLGELVGGEVTNSAIFGSYDFRAGDLGFVTLDLRVARDEIGYVRSDKQGSESWYSWTPSLSYRRDWGANGLLYGSLSQAKKPGGFNADLEGLSFQDEAAREEAFAFFTFDEEKVTTLEFGARNEALNETLWWDLSVYRSNWEDLQLSQSLSYLDGAGRSRRVSSIANGGKAELYGLELEGRWLITEELEANFGIGYSYSKLEDTYTTAQEDLTGDGSVNGNQVPNAPEFDGTFALTYRRELSSGLEFFVRPVFTYEGERFVAEHNLAILEDLERFDLTVGLKGDDWTFSVWGKDLNQDKALDSANRFGDAATFFVRRAFGLDLPEKRRIGMSFSRRY